MTVSSQVEASTGLAHLAVRTEEVSEGDSLLAFGRIRCCSACTTSAIAHQQMKLQVETGDEDDVACLSAHERS